MLAPLISFVFRIDMKIPRSYGVVFFFCAIEEETSTSSLNRAWHARTTVLTISLTRNPTHQNEKQANALYS